MSDWWNQPTRLGVKPPASTAEALPACPWCAEPTLPDASNCSNCGAVMAQDGRSVLEIPGPAGLVVDDQQECYRRNPSCERRPEGREERL